MLRRLRFYLSAAASVRDIEPLRAGCDGATELVDALEDGSARSAAWAAYALQTYGDKLLAACARDGYVDPETAGVVRASYRLAAVCVGVARGEPGDVPGLPPHWHTPLRTRGQLAGMRDALESLRTYLAYALPGETSQIDAELAKAERLWIENPPPELRGGIGDALAEGLDLAYETGRRRLTA